MMKYKERGWTHDSIAHKIEPNKRL